MDRTTEFFLQLFSGNPHVVGILLSFIGWCGVPVFVLLSGYGLSKKYGRRDEKINELSFIKYNYLKLLSLILPAVIFFLTFYSIEGSWKTVLKGLFSLTFLNTFIPGFNSIAPPFWYFSLTFQLYLAFLLLYRVKNWKVLTVIGIIFLSLYIVVGPDCLQSDILLKRMRLTLFGWIPVFVIGILLARDNNILMTKAYIDDNMGNCVKYGILSILIIVSLVLLTLVNKNYYLWILMPFIAIVFFYSIALLVERVPGINSVSLWLGKFSPYIFVSHPIALLVIEHVFNDLITDMPLSLLAVMYTLLFLTISSIYNILHLRILKLINKQ